MKIYHNPRCKKSRETLKIIEETGEQPEIIKYMDNPPTDEELNKILSKLDMEPQDLLRKGEKIYKEKFKDKDFSREEWVRIMTENPKLIERPVVIEGNKAVIGRPPENVKELL